jgi:hypothetical protein
MCFQLGIARLGGLEQDLPLLALAVLAGVPDHRKNRTDHLGTGCEPGFHRRSGQAYGVFAGGRGRRYLEVTRHAPERRSR